LLIALVCFLELAEEVEFVMNGGDPADVIQAVIMQGNEAADPIKAAYAHATDKYQDVLLLESSVRDLHEMFMHFALLTERQGELLDNIEAQVHSTGDLIASGNENLLEAVNLQKAARYDLDVQTGLL
jgi:t-SNARE complex subunit (syntaxin)